MRSTMSLTLWSPRTNWRSPETKDKFSWDTKREQSPSARPTNSMSTATLRRSLSATMGQTTMIPLRSTEFQLGLVGFSWANY